MISTSAQDVVSTFASAGEAAGRFAEWHRHPRRQHVATRVMLHRAEAVYTVSSEDVRTVASEHPLRKVRPQQGYAVEPIKNWRPDFAFTHLFHFCLEEMGRVFTFGEFRAHSGLEANAAMLWQPAHGKLLEAEAQGYCRQAARDAMVWRVGLAYYSFLRELYVVARLRECGLDMRTHPLADALFRADAWHGNTVLTVYVNNTEFRHGSAGRKPPAEEVLADRHGRFQFVALGMKPGREFGRVHLPSDREIDNCAAAIRRTALRSGGTSPAVSTPRSQPAPGHASAPPTSATPSSRPPTQGR